MLKQFMSLGFIMAISVSTQANIFEIAAAAMGVQNAAIMDQAEARMGQSRAQAAYAVQRATQTYNQQVNQANQITSQNYNTQPSYNTDGSYTTQFLRSLDCADLAVEARTAQRYLKNYNQQNTTSDQDALKAGLATAALSLFAGNQNTQNNPIASIASAFTNQPENSSEAQVALINLDNIQVFQQSKNCRVL